MGRTVRDTNLETRTARGRLSPRGKPYYRSIDPGLHLGYRKGKRGGKWVVRRLMKGGNYQVETIGTADDVSDADGLRILDWKQAQAAARSRGTELARHDAGLVTNGPYTVKCAVEDYLTWSEGNRQTRNEHALKNDRYRVDGFILPELGSINVAELTSDRIRRWLTKLAETPPRVRSKGGRPAKHRDTSGDPDAERKRRSSANRVLTILKAALNHAWHEGKVENDSAWRRVKPFRGVDAPKIRYLAEEECIRLVEACAPDFRQLVQGALFTGCRYGELTAFRVADFDPKNETIFVRESKSGKRRHVVLTAAGAKFFKAIAADQPDDALLFQKEGGSQWGRTHQQRPLADACVRAEIIPAASFHVLRHTYASHLVMNGVSLQVVAKNLGHADTRMTERHYAHLADSYVAETIRKAAPELGVPKKKKEGSRRRAPRRTRSVGA